MVAWGSQRQGHAAAGKLLVGQIEKRPHPADAEVIDRLVDDLLDHDRREPCIQRTGQFLGKLFFPLAAQQRRQNRHVAGDGFELLAGLVHDLVKGKMVKALGKFRVGLVVVLHSSALLCLYGLRIVFLCTAYYKMGRG